MMRSLPALCVLAVLQGTGACDLAAAQDAAFAVIPSPLDGHQVDDLGVVDADGDGRLDLFTSNHESAASLRLSAGEGRFMEVGAQWGFGADADRPGIETARIIPRQSGLHVYFKRSELVIRNADAPPMARPLRGRVELGRRTKWITEGGVHAVGTGRERRRGQGQSVDFVADGDGQLKFLPPLPAGEVTVELDADVPLDAVRLGSRALPVTSHRFVLPRIDRHGMAWSDYDADGDLDVYVSVGGALGLASTAVNDQLLVQDERRFRDAAVAAGIDKRGSRGRRVEWVDHDGDGRLDAYVGNLKTANQLWVQGEDGRFVDRASELGLDFDDGDRFRWFDADGDGDADLLVAGRGGPARLYRNRGGRFRAETIAGSQTADPRQLVLADVDADGDVDVLLVDAGFENGGNRLLLAHKGSFTAEDATARGLPAHSAAAAWVDFDNDGRVDLHTVPDGLFRQGEDGRFTAAGLPVKRKLQDVRCAWLDLDDDGDRDGLCELIVGYFDVEHVAYRNDSPSARWLELDLVGPPTNRQAIGAIAVVETASGRRSAHMVGEAETSHLSQGHYRIYVGLGAEEKVKSIDVTWPGGKVQRIEDVEADNRVIVRYETEPVNP